MSSVHVIGNLANLVWITIPFFKRKSEYFYFFVVTAVPGIYQFISMHVLHITSSPIVIPYSLLLIPSLYKSFFKSNIIVLSLAGLIAFPVFYTVDGNIHQIFCLFIHIAVLIILASRTTNIALTTGKLNIFTLLLLLYELSMVVKLIPIVKADLNSIELYMLTTIFQIFVGLFFTYAKEDNPKLIIKLSSPDL